MNAAVGDRIVIDSNKVGQKPREGVILEVIETDVSSHYRVQWDDGVETTVWPSGSVRTIPQEKRAKAGSTH